MASMASVKLDNEELAELLMEFERTPKKRVLNIEANSPPSPGFVYVDSLTPKAYDITGMRFGLLVALRPWSQHILPSGYPDGLRWVCKCDCGRFRIVLGNRLTRANGTKSCGCILNEIGKDVMRRLYDPSLGKYALPKRIPASSKVKHLTDLKGQTFGYLTVKSLSHFMRHVSANGHNTGKTMVRNKPYWNCVCVCGTQVVKDRDVLYRSRQSGTNMSCGCRRHERKSK